MLPKAIYLDLMWSLSNYPWYFSQELEQTLKFIWNHKRPRTAKAILREKNKAGGITLPNIRQYYKATGIETAWCRHKDIHMNQWNKTESRSKHITPMDNSSLTKKQEYRMKESIFSKLCWKSWTVSCKSKKVEHTSYHTQSESHSVVSDSLRAHGLYNPWNSPGQNTGVAFPFSRGSSQPRDWTQVSCMAGRFFTSWATKRTQMAYRQTYVCEKSLSPVWLAVTPRTVAPRASPSMEFSRQKYCSGVPCPSPGHLPNSAIEPRSLALQADSLPSEPLGRW